MNDMNSIMPFDYKTKQVRVVRDEVGAPWWIAKDVCDILELSDVSMAVSRLDEDEKDTSSIGTLGGFQKMITVNEPGLYTLILGSKKPEAKPFKRWITHEVLPAIRKTGYYGMPGSDQPSPGQPSRKSQIAYVREEIRWIDTVGICVKKVTMGEADLESIRENAPGIYEAVKKRVRERSPDKKATNFLQDVMRGIDEYPFALLKKGVLSIHLSSALGVLVPASRHNELKAALKAHPAFIENNVCGYLSERDKKICKVWRFAVNKGKGAQKGEEHDRS